MGIRAAYTEITKSQVKLILAGDIIPQDQIFAQTTYHIDKAWYPFHEVFSRQVSPLDIIIVGDIDHPMSSHSIQKLIDAQIDFYIGLFSHTYISEVNGVLANLSIDEIKRWFNKENVVFDDYITRHYKSLVQMFHDVSVHKNALQIVVA